MRPSMGGKTIRQRCTNMTPIRVWISRGHQRNLKARIVVGGSLARLVDSLSTPRMEMSDSRSQDYGKLALRPIETFGELLTEIGVSLNTHIQEVDDIRQLSQPLYRWDQGKFAPDGMSPVFHNNERAPQSQTHYFPVAEAIYDHSRLQDGDIVTLKKDKAQIPLVRVLMNDDVPCIDVGVYRRSGISLRSTHHRQ